MQIAIFFKQLKQIKKMKAYQIIHCYDVDGGFGDAVHRIETLAIVLSEKNANEYVTKWSNQKVYSEPYDKLYFGKLKIEPIEIIEKIDLRKNLVPNFLDK